MQHQSTEESSWDVDNAVFFAKSHWDGDVDDCSYEELFVAPQTTRLMGSPYTTSSNKKSYYKTKTRISMKPSTQRKERDLPPSGIEYNLDREVRFVRPSYDPEIKNTERSLHKQLTEALRAVQAYRY